MVLLTTNYIEKECVRTQSLKSLTKKISKNNFRTITHLYMNGKFVDAIVSLYSKQINNLKEELK